MVQPQWVFHDKCFFFYRAKYLLLSFIYLSICLSGIFSLFFNFMARFGMFRAHCLDISENIEKA